MLTLIGSCHYSRDKSRYNFIVDAVLWPSHDITRHKHYMSSVPYDGKTETWANSITFHHIPMPICTAHVDCASWQHLQSTMNIIRTAQHASRTSINWYIDLNRIGSLSNSQHWGCFNFHIPSSIGQHSRRTLPHSKLSWRTTILLLSVTSTKENSRTHQISLCEGDENKEIVNAYLAGVLPSVVRQLLVSNKSLIPLLFY